MHHIIQFWKNRMNGLNRIINTLFFCSLLLNSSAMAGKLDRKKSAFPSKKNTIESKAYTTQTPCNSPQRSPIKKKDRRKPIDFLKPISPFIEHCPSRQLSFESPTKTPPSLSIEDRLSRVSISPPSRSSDSPFSAIANSPIPTNPDIALFNLRQAFLLEDESHIFNNLLVLLVQGIPLNTIIQEVSCKITEEQTQKFVRQKLVHKIMGELQSSKPIKPEDYSDLNKHYIDGTLELPSFVSQVLDNRHIARYDAWTCEMELNDANHFREKNINDLFNMVIKVLFSADFLETQEESKNLSYFLISTSLAEAQKAGENINCIAHLITEIQPFIFFYPEKTLEGYTYGLEIDPQPAYQSVMQLIAQNNSGFLTQLCENKRSGTVSPHIEDIISKLHRYFSYFSSKYMDFSLRKKIKMDGYKNRDEFVRIGKIKLNFTEDLETLVQERLASRRTAIPNPFFGPESQP